MYLGTLCAVFGAAFATFLCGLGSTLGVHSACKAGAGLLRESPDKFNKILPLMLIPASQAIYGMLTGFLVMIKIDALGTIVNLTVAQGMVYFAFCVPIAIVGFVSAIFQGSVCVSGIAMVAKRDESQGNAMVMAVMVEVFAILALIISLLGVALLKF